jgi:proteasome lid subunit RPN8/RPN11
MAVRSPRRARLMTEVRVSSVWLARLLDHAAGGYPLAVCGLLIGDNDGAALRVTRVVPCPNTAPPAQRRQRCAIDPRAVSNVRRALHGTPERVLGFYRSEPDGAAGTPVAGSEQVRPWPGAIWLVVPVARGDAGAPRAWWLDGAGAAGPRELAVRPFHPSTGLAPCPDPVAAARGEAREDAR